MRTPSSSKTPRKPRGGPPRARDKASRPERPAVDERLVMPETRFEIVDGNVSYVAPAGEPHGHLHAKVAAVVEADVASAFATAIDMLTRTSIKGDMAPDVSVYPRDRDPDTGGRWLDDMAFEVVSTERLAHAGRMAAAEAAIGRALLARGNPELAGALAEADARGEARSEAQGVAAGKVEALLSMLVARGVAVGGANESRIRGAMDLRTLDTWIAKGAVCTNIRALFIP